MRSVKHGFTLLEIVLALAIFAVMMTLIASILFSARQGWVVVRESTTELEMLLRLERLADTAFRNAIPFRWPNDNRREVQIFRGEPDFLRLAYLHRINDPGEGGIRFLELSLQGSALTAHYRPYPLLDDSERGKTDEIIAEGIRKLTFSYALRKNGEILWQSEFDAVAAGTIPPAIRMDVEWENGRKTSFLRRTAGHSHRSSYGKFRENTYAEP